MPLLLQYSFMKMLDDVLYRQTMKDRTSGERLGDTYMKEGEQPLGTKDIDVCTKL